MLILCLKVSPYLSIGPKFLDLLRPRTEAGLAGCDLLFWFHFRGLGLLMWLSTYWKDKFRAPKMNLGETVAFSVLFNSGLETNSSLPQI